MFWHSMNQEFMFKGKTDKVKVVRIVGRDSVNFFNSKGLSDIRPTEEDILQQMSGQSTEPILEGPVFPVELDNGDVKPKFEPDQLGEGGNLYVEEGDVNGFYDYIPDIESMEAPSNEDVEAKLTAILGTLTNPAVTQMIAAEGKKPKVVDLLVKMFEATKVIKDADSFFEDLPPQNQGIGGEINGQNRTNQGGVNPTEAGIPGQGNSANQGMAGGAEALARVQNPQ